MYKYFTVHNWAYFAKTHLHWDTKIKQNLNVANVQKNKLWTKIPAAKHLITTENKEWQDCHEKKKNNNFLIISANSKQIQVTNSWFYIQCNLTTHV